MRKLKILIFCCYFLISTAFGDSSAEKVKITEINFKNSDSDWLELEVVNITKNLIVETENNKLTLEAGKISDVSRIIIELNSSESYEKNEKNTFWFGIKNKSLKNTKDHLIIKNEEKILDQICWNKDDQNCLNSNLIKKNNSFSLINDQWVSTKYESKGEQNILINSAPEAIIKIQKGNTEDTVPFSINLDGSQSIDPDDDELSYFWEFPDKNFTTKNPPSYKFENEGIYKINLTVIDTQGLKDTNTLEIKAIKPKKAIVNKKNIQKLNFNKDSITPHQIVISEVFPNPNGTDKGKEWIELSNNSNKSITITNWKIAIGQKIYSLRNTTFQPFSTYIFENLTSIPNQNTEIFLLDNQNQVRDKINFPKAMENQSYTKIKINSNYEWLWNPPTKNKQNITAEKKTYLITSEAEIGKEYYFKAKDINTSEELSILFKEPFDFKNIKNSLKKGSHYEITHYQEKGEIYLLDFKPIFIREDSPQAKKTKLDYLFIINGLIIFVILFRDQIKKAALYTHERLSRIFNKLNQ